MSNPTLSHYHRHLRPINDDQKTDAMLALLVKVPGERQNDFWIRGSDSGTLCLWENEAFPGVVLEYVQGSQEDSVTTLYESCPMLATRQSLIDTRTSLINEIGALLMALPSTIAVYDGGREREAMLNELGTAQLIDVLAHFSHTDLATL